MAIASVVCRGYGTFGGGVARLPARGYGAPVPATPAVSGDGSSGGAAGHWSPLLKTRPDALRRALARKHATFHAPTLRLSLRLGEVAVSGLCRAQLETATAPQTAYRQAAIQMAMREDAALLGLAWYETEGTGIRLAGDED